MGVFLIELRDRGRIARGVARNTLMYRAHDLLFGGAFGDPTSGTKIDCEIGISGPEFQLHEERPVDFSTEDFHVGPRNRLDDFEGDYGNEGGLLSSDARDVEAYARQAVTWTITRDGRGTIIDTGWLNWVSRIPWYKLGSDKPPNWDTELHPTGPSYHEPDPWFGIPPYENQSQDFPWATPVESPRYWDAWTWTDLASATHSESPQSGFPACPSGVTYGLWGLSGVPIGQSYIAIKRGDTWEILAAANINGPAWWRRSGSIYARYVGRWGV